MTATVIFSVVSDAATAECRLNGGAFESCKLTLYHSHSY